LGNVEAHDDAWRETKGCERKRPQRRLVEYLMSTSAREKDDGDGHEGSALVLHRAVLRERESGHLTVSEGGWKRVCRRRGKTASASRKSRCQERVRLKVSPCPSRGTRANRLRQRRGGGRNTRKGTSGKGRADEKKEPDEMRRWCRFPRTASDGGHTSVVVVVVLVGSCRRERVVMKGSSRVVDCKKKSETWTQRQQGLPRGLPVSGRGLRRRFQRQSSSEEAGFLLRSSSSREKSDENSLRWGG
jgi:hypothetical protein